MKDIPVTMAQAKREARVRYAAARRALDENSFAEYAAGVDYETPEFLRLNHEVAEAEPGISPWRRWLIDARISRDLDYWHRMRQIRRQRERRVS
jgi:hypothetical protein